MINGRVGTPHVHAMSLMNAQQRVMQIPKRNEGQHTPPLGTKPGQSTGILASRGPVTQHFGQKSQYDVFSHGISPAYEVAVPSGTAITAPPGSWRVKKAFGEASKKGHIGNFEGNGWGNHVWLQNTQTGEVVGMNHLQDVHVQEGQLINQGERLGSSGMSGNATGPHVAFTYADPTGRVADFEKSPYLQYLYQGIQQIPGVQQVEGALGHVAGAIGQAAGSVGSAVGHLFQPPAQPTRPASFSSVPLPPVSPPPSIADRLVPQTPSNAYQPLYRSQI